MHVIIAGAARSGKTTISVMMNKYGFVHYKMDSIKRGLGETFDINYDDWGEVSPIMCRIINRMIKDQETDTNNDKEKYLIDIPYIYPKDISMIDTKDTLVIFMGYPNLTYEEAFNAIRKYDKPSFWTSKASDEVLMKWCKENVDFSKYLESECKKYNIKFFDISHNREEVFNSIKEYILEEEKSRK